MFDTSDLEWTIQVDVDMLNTSELVKCMRMIDKATRDENGRTIYCVDIDSRMANIGLELQDNAIALWLTEILDSDMPTILRILAENKDKVRVKEISHELSKEAFIKTYGAFCFSAMLDTIDMIARFSKQEDPYKDAWTQWKTMEGFDKFVSEFYGDDEDE